MFTYLTAVVLIIALVSRNVGFIKDSSMASFRDNMVLNSMVFYELIWLIYVVEAFQKQSIEKYKRIIWFFPITSGAVIIYNTLKIYLMANHSQNELINYLSQKKYIVDEMMLVTILILGSATFIILIYCYTKAKDFESIILKYHIISFTLSFLAILYIIVCGYSADTIVAFSLSMVVSELILTMLILRYNMLYTVPLDKEIAIECLEEAFLIIDSNNYILDCNDSAKKLFEELNDIVLPTNVKNVKFLWENVINGPSLDFEKEVDGQLKYFETRIFNIGADKTLNSYCLLINDITEIHVVMEEYKKLALYDPLTQINNRNAFIESFTSVLKRKSKKDFDKNWYFIMLDVDYFKKINDTYGHRCGDYVLREIVTLIREQLNDSCLFGRYGGEEFIIAYKNEENISKEEVAENIRTAIENHVFQYGDYSFNVTVSGGAVDVNINSEKTFEDYALKADNLLYKAKNEGRNRIEL